MTGAQHWHRSHANGVGVVTDETAILGRIARWVGSLTEEGSNGGDLGR